MKYENYFKISFPSNTIINIDYINRVCKNKPNEVILLEIENTKGLTSTMLKKLNPNVEIRIKGGYTDERIKHHGKKVFKSGETGAYYTYAVIYKRNEVIKIIEEMEKIEIGINPRWSEIQKLVYIYDRLKTSIMYDPKFERKHSSEIRSLRGLITKQTVCAGYSLILKEMLDRQGIECEYVEGYTKKEGRGGHAWNIVTINGKKYPIDLTWDNTKFRSGQANTYDYLGQNIEEFCQNHFPVFWEPTQNYKTTLSQINPELIRGIGSQIAREKKYATTTYYGERRDGTKYIVAQLGNLKIDGTEYYRYYYIDTTNKNTRPQPLILYSETNVTEFVEAKKFGKTTKPHIEEAIDSILFSRENIADSLAKKTYYIGNVHIDDKRVVRTIKKIEKPSSKNRLFTYRTKCFQRSDGSVFIAQQMLKTPIEIKGIPVMRYDIFEMVKENGRDVLKRNIVFTERNFFNDPRQSMIDDFLSRSRLDRKVNEAGGYIGYYDANGFRTYNPDLVNHFSTAKRIDIDSLDKSIPKITPLPTFQELKNLAAIYEISIDSATSYDNVASKIKVRNIKTKKVETDEKIIPKAIFANIWLASAGAKWMSNEERNGFNYAFNEPAEKLYNIICYELNQSISRNGVIDTVKLYKDITKKNNYKYNEQIIVNLFRTPFQTNIINELFLKANGISNSTRTPEPLYTLQYAGSIDSESKKRK